MREIRTSGLMSGDGKRGTAIAPVLDSTTRSAESQRKLSQLTRLVVESAMGVSGSLEVCYACPIRVEPPPHRWLAMRL
jgi:hypothetical protein